ncbi:MAG TPA: GNAT family N-acetyltransferase [Steroidobacteraceae bacterium]
MSVNADFDESMQFGPVGSHTLLLQTRYPVIATSRLRLRPFTLVDIPRLISVVAAHRIADSTLAVPRPFDARQARHWIESHSVEWRRRCAIHWAVSGLEHDRLAGYVGLHEIQLEHGRANLSFWIADRIARKDLAIEAAQAALAFAFTSLQLDAVEAHQLTGNPLMARILRRLGMKPEAGTPQPVIAWGRSEDVLGWNISRTAWMATLQDQTAH